MKNVVLSYLEKKEIILNFCKIEYCGEKFKFSSKDIRNWKKDAQVKIIFLHCEQRDQNLWEHLCYQFTSTKSIKRAKMARRNTENNNQWI